MPAITANDLKIKGISVVDNALLEEDEVVITVRGMEKYVVMNMRKYNQLREYELSMAVNEARADYESGNVKRESIDEHMKRVAD